MRCSGWSSLAISGCSAAVALVLTASAGAHVVATPSYIATGSIGTLTLSAPNERDVPMTGFKVTVPDGFVIEHAHASGPWDSTFGDSTASWSGSSLPAGNETTFGIDVDVTGEPGQAVLETEQLYPKGDVVRTTVPITVVPAVESPSQNLALAAVVGLVGLLVVAGIAAFAWWRRGGSLQER